LADDRTYIKVHDGMYDHPKIEGLSDGAFRLLVGLWCWCSQHLTDGHVPAASWARRGTPKQRRELVTAGLAEETLGGVLMHDYLEHQRSAAQVEEIKQVRAAAGVKANHVRWHVKAGILDPTCEHCTDGPTGIPPASQNGSHPDPLQESDGASDSDPNRSPETETETENGDKLRSKGRASTRGKRRTKLPDDLDLSGARARYAHDHGMSREVAHREFATFRAWHAAKGSDHYDWDQAWLTWVLRWEKNTPKPQVEAHPDLPEGWS
jgi:hypothetical protein